MAKNANKNNSVKNDSVKVESISDDEFANLETGKRQQWASKYQPGTMITGLTPGQVAGIKRNLIRISNDMENVKCYHGSSNNGYVALSSKWKSNAEQ